jgi:hypothetical protein
VFGSTTNETSDFLTDPTGDARFWVVRAGQLQFSELERDRDQLWAEAVQAYRAGEPWHLISADDKELVKRSQTYATRIDLQVQELLSWRAEGIPDSLLTSRAEDTGETYISVFSDQLDNGVPRYFTVEQVCTAFGIDKVNKQHTALGWLKAAGFLKAEPRRVDKRRITPYMNPDLIR